MRHAMTPTIDRIMRRVVEMSGPLDTPCWVPTYKTDSHGYVQVSAGRRGSGRRPAHRVTYEHFVGPIPEGLQIDHLCRVRKCVNPAHLEAVTHAENVQRGESPLIIAHRTNTCIRGHSLDDAYRSKKGRQCRVCCLAWQRQRRLFALADNDPRHGTENGYSNCGCRCEACRQAKSRSDRDRAQRPARTGNTSLLALALAIGTLAALAFATPAFANPSQASATCQGGISYEGHSYPASGNTVTVSWDGHVVKTVTFGSQTSGTVANPDKTVAHSWQVVWDRSNGADGDREQHGTVEACVAVTTTTAATTTTSTTLASTTTVAPPASTIVATDDEITPVVVVAVADPPVPPAAITPEPQGVSAAFNQTLPVTGRATSTLWYAAALVACGFVGVAIARRRE